MKHVNSQGSSRPALTVKTLLGGAAVAALMGLSFNAQAQTCVVSNWLGGPTGVSDTNAGTQDTAATNNRRYGGPCGLRVPVSGAAAFVTDDTPSAEGTYIARFYTYLNNAGGDAIIIFEADDGTDPQAQVWYNFPTAGDMTLRVFDSGGLSNDLSFSSIPSGWTSVEFVWEAAAAANLAFSVNGAPDLTTTIDTSGITLANASLGNINAAANGTSIDFDAFDSRRISRPGRLCRGLTDEARAPLPGNTVPSLNIADVQAIFGEFSTNGASPANGIPDYNEDGFVNIADVSAVFTAFSTAQNSCDLNS
jgi:hypothetical protein